MSGLLWLLLLLLLLLLLGNAYKPSTMRQTQVIVIPSAPEFTESFLVFDSLVTTLNQARRNARDYITDSMLDDQEDDDEDDDDENQWSVAINLAHLHPLYGQRTPAQQVQDFRDEEAAGEVDVHLQEYKRLRLAARRSPYPTIVIEVRASPTPNFGTTTPSSSSSATNRPSSSSGNGVSLSDIQKLEALFGKTAHMKDSSSQDDAFWDAVGRSMKEITSVTPVKLAQQWIANHHDAATTLSAEEEAASTIVAFTTSSTAHVDEAYEFVFTNIAMLQEQYGVADASTDNNNNNDKSNHQQQQQYLVLPHFLSAAATSFENFSNEVTQLVACLPSLKGKLTVTTYHPEHIQANRRSPTPILALTWNNNHHHNKNNTSSS